MPHPEDPAEVGRPVSVPEPGLTRRRVLGFGAVAGLGLLAADGPAPRSRSRPGTTAPTPVVDVRDLGAVGDGVADDGPAVRRGLEVVNASGGTLWFPPGTYEQRVTGPLRPGAGVHLRGVPGASALVFRTVDAGEFVPLLSITAPRVTIDGLSLVHRGESRAVVLDIGATTRLRLSRSTLDGGVSASPGQECHGIKLPDSGVLDDLVIDDSTVRDLTYGLFSTNGSTARIRAVRVERCTFVGNHATDLEFNSPRGSTRDLRVTDCRFSDNRYLGNAAGFGVGLAHVADAVVEGCTFTGYQLEAIHVEDYSDRVSITGNRFAACGLRLFSYVQVISGSRRVEVADNTFDATANEQPVYVVAALPGGTGTTVGGRPPGGPTDVAVRGNSMDCSRDAVPVYFQAVTGGFIERNVVTGPAVSSPADAFTLLEDPGTVVRANRVNGRLW